MTTTMLKKVARAIEDAMSSDDNAPDDLARAALIAMREPDEGMLDAGTAALWPPGRLKQMLPGEASVTAFTAMIDHILNDGGE